MFLENNITTQGKIRKDIIFSSSERLMLKLVFCSMFISKYLTHSVYAHMMTSVDNSFFVVIPTFVSSLDAPDDERVVLVPVALVDVHPAAVGDEVRATVQGGVVKKMGTRLRELGRQ